jgi:DNA repair protein RAD57
MFPTDDPLSLDHQQKFFTGWGDNIALNNLKTPSLGLALTSQLATRVALTKIPVYKDKSYAAGEERELDRWSRTCRIVFSAWCPPADVPFEIFEGGIRSIPGKEEKISHPIGAVDHAQQINDK